MKPADEARIAARLAQLVAMICVRNTALLRKSGFDRTSPFPRRTDPTGSGTGMPRAV